MIDSDDGICVSIVSTIAFPTYKPTNFASDVYSDWTGADLYVNSS